MTSALPSTFTTVTEETTTTASDVSSPSGPLEPLVPPLVLFGLGLMLSVESIFNFLANCTALYIFYKNKHLRSPTNAFIMALCVCDLTMALFMPLSASSAFAGRWLWGYTGCVIEGFAFYFLGLTSLYVLAAIALDRYVVIAKPLQAPMITYRVVMLAIAACAFFGLLWSALPLVGWSHYDLEGARISCSVVWESGDPSIFSYNVTIFFNCFIFPIVAMLFSYYHVYMTIRTVARNSVFDAGSRVAKRNIRVERKMAKTVFAMISTFVLSWSPYAIVSFMAVFGTPVSALTATLPAIVAKGAGFWNPIIYVATNKLFRGAVYQVMPCGGLRSCLQRCEEDKESSDDDNDNTRNKTDTRTKETAPAAQTVPVTAVQPEISEQMETTMEDLASPAKRLPNPAPGNSAPTLTPVETMEMNDVKNG